MILFIRTDAPEVEVGIARDGEKVKSHRWEAGRKLSQELLPAIEESLRDNEAGWADVTGIVAFKGPGSFTGLRIGITTANALAYGLSVPVVGAAGRHWQEDGVKQLKKAKPGSFVMPEYGREANITQPKK